MEPCSNAQLADVIGIEARSIILRALRGSILSVECGCENRMPRRSPTLV